MSESVTVRNHDSKFVINDVELRIPPTQISINRNAANHVWQTLRTNTAQKVKSGHGTIDITVSFTIVGRNAINEQLIPLVTQLKLTPICYVENRYIRDDLLPRLEDEKKNMAMIMKSMSISVTPELVDTVQVDIAFGWFNYEPYVPNFQFKQDTFNPIPVSEPKHSIAWLKFYNPWLKRHKKVGRNLGTKLEFIYNKYVIGPQVDTFDTQTTRDEITNTLRSTLEDETKQLKSIREGKTEDDELFQEAVVAQLEQALKGVTDIEPGNFVPTGFIYDSGKNNDKENLTLWRKTDRVLATADTSLTCVGLTVTFENIVACLPVIGHQYMTYQHMGSIDPVVTVQLMATSDASRKQITTMWNDVEQMAIDLRHIPQQYLNIQINNDLIAAMLVGNKETPHTPRMFITDQMFDQTIPGQPGTWQMTLVLRQTDLKFKEEIQQEFVSDDRVRAKILEVLASKLKTESARRTLAETTNINRFARSRLSWLSGLGVLAKIADLLPDGTKIVAKTTIPSDDRCRLMHDLTDRLANEINANARELSVNINALLTSPDTWRRTGEEDPSSVDGVPESEKEALRLWILIKTLEPEALSKIFQEVVAGELTSYSRVRIGQLEELVEAGPSDLSPLKRGPNRDNYPVAFFAFLQEFVDNIILSNLYDIDEFGEARELADEVGTFRGKPTYIDFPTLVDVAALERINVLDIEPDFYFFNPTLDRIGEIIDPAYINAAQNHALKLYSNAGGTGGFGRDISNFVQNVYINSLEGELKDRFEKDWAAIGDGNGKETTHGAVIKDPATPHIAAPSVDQEEYQNATADGLEVHRMTADTYYYTNEFPDADDIDQNDTSRSRDGRSGGKIVQSQGDSISHFGGVEGAFENLDSASFRAKSEAKSFGYFKRPVSGRPTSLFGPRNARNPKASRNHKGVDYRAVEGTPVQAAASGRITHLGFEDSNDESKGFGLRIRMVHPEIDDKVTVYAHLKKGSIQTSPSKNRPWQVGDTVTQGDVLALSGATGSATFVADDGTFRVGPHLHFEIRSRSGQALDPENIFKFQAPRDTASGTGFKFGNSIFNRSMEQFQDDLVNGQALRMNRAYPTFKLYFIEEDNVEQRRFAFDDFFSYNAVKSIRVVRSRKIAADFCEIELTNVSGILSNRDFNRDKDPRNKEGKVSKENPRNPLATNTIAENPIASMMLQEGMKVELRLGYSNDPDKLEALFVGQIVEVQFTQTDDLVLIRCQSYATELQQNIKGLTKITNRENGWFVKTTDASTRKILTDMMHQPELVHFGRWKRSTQLGRPTNINRKLLNNHFEFNPKPQDDNIFAPDDSHLMATNVITREAKTFVRNRILTSLLPGGLFIPSFVTDPIINKHLGKVNDLHYYIYKTTIWDIFKEMELRHPECIASPVSYKDLKLGPRMTMFFGIPNQLYFARDPNYKERREIEVLTNTVRQNEENLEETFDQIADLHGVRRLSEIDELLIKTQQVSDGIAIGSAVTAFSSLGFAQAGTLRIAQELLNVGSAKKRRLRKRYINHIQKNLALRNRSIKPFRSYHVITSSNHIVRNDLASSALDTYNTVSVGYFKGSGGIEERLQHVQNVKPPQDVFRLKVNAALPDEKVQEMFIQYPSCEGKTMAKYYALGALKRSLRDVYKGSLVILGNPAIKPYDICYVFDEYTDMIGPVEVEQVVHLFSQESGFLTEITPDLSIALNEWTTLGTMDAIGLIAEGAIKNIFKRTIGDQADVAEVKTPGGITLGVSNALIALGLTTSAIAAPGTFLIGAFLFNKAVEMSQFRNPFSFSPLLLKGRPMLAGVGSRTLNSNWWNQLGQWVKEGTIGLQLSIDDLLDRITIAPRGDLLNGFYGDTGPSF